MNIYTILTSTSITIMMIPAIIVFAFVYSKLTNRMTNISDKYKAPSEIIVKIDWMHRVVHVFKGNELFGGVDTMPYETFVSFCKVKSRVEVNEKVNELSQSEVDLLNPAKIELEMRYKADNIPYILNIKKYQAESKFIFCYLKHNPLATLINSDGESHLRNIVPFSVFKDNALVRAQKHKHNKHLIFFIKIDGADRLADTFEQATAKLIIKETVKKVSYAFGSRALVSRDNENNIWIFKPGKKTAASVSRSTTLKYIKGVQAKIATMKLEEAIKVQTKLVVGSCVLEGDTSRQSLDFVMKKAIFSQTMAADEGSVSNYFIDQYQEEFDQEQELVMQIRRAISKKEVAIKYQPMINLSDGKVTGYTVTSSLPDVDCNFGKVIDLVNRYIGAQGFNILLLGAIVSKTASNEIDTYINFDAKIANAHNDFVGLLKEWGWNKDVHFLELTNTGSLTSEDLKKLCKNLKDNEVRVCLDNYDDNHESPSNLGQYLPNAIKIRKYINNIHVNDESMVKAVEYVNQCNKKGISVIATRVESEYEMYVLAKVGIMAAEGFYIAKPDEQMTEPEEDVVKKILKSRKNIFLN